MRTRENKCQISQIDIFHMTIVVTILVKFGLVDPVLIWIWLIRDQSAQAKFPVLGGWTYLNI